MLQRSRNRHLAPPIVILGVLIATEFSAAATRVSGKIDADTTWSAAGNPYAVVGDLLVTTRATLTISAGTVVQVLPNCRLDIQGAIDANGDSRHPILFIGTESHVGAWKGIQIWQRDIQKTSRLSYVSIRYGGALELAESLAVLDNVTVADSDGIRITGNSNRAAEIKNSKIVRNRGCGIHVKSDGRPVISNTSILMNEGYAICIDQGFTRFGQSPATLRLSDLTVSGNGGGTRDAIDFRETGSAGDETLGPGLDWIISNSVLNVRPGARLTILPGTVLRFPRGGSLYVSGTLISDGTPARPVTFTASGADRWDCLYFNAPCSNSIIRNTIVSHSERAIYVNDCAPAFEKITIQDSLWPAVLSSRNR